MWETLEFVIPACFFRHRTPPQGFGRMRPLAHSDGSASVEAGIQSVFRMDPRQKHPG